MKVEKDNFQLRSLGEVLPLKIGDIMTNPVVSIGDTSTARQAAQIMRDHNIGSVPVLNSNSDLVGIVTDRDIVLRNVADGVDVNKSLVKDIMSPYVATANQSMDICEASKIMKERQIRRLPVVEGNKVVGMVALGDIAVCSENDTEIAETLTNISFS